MFLLVPFAIRDRGISLSNNPPPRQTSALTMKDARRSGRPITDKMDAIFEKVEQDRHVSSYDVAEELGIDHKTVLAHLKKNWVHKKARYLGTSRAH